MRKTDIETHTSGVAYLDEAGGKRTEILNRYTEYLKETERNDRVQQERKEEDDRLLEEEKRKRSVADQSFAKT